MKKVLVIGNYSGRNAGDAAILDGLLRDVYGVTENVQFLIPTINKTFVESTYRHYPIKAVPLMPWNLSLKIFGWPIFRETLNANLILLTDAILFDRKLWNPITNYLFTMSLILPFARGKGIPIVLYNSSLGPITSKKGERCLRKVLDSAELVILRERESLRMLKSLELDGLDIRLAADSALNVSAVDPSDLQKAAPLRTIIRDKDNFISFNVSCYIDTWFKNNGERIGIEGFVRLMADTITKAIDELDTKILLVATQYMDCKISKRLLARIDRPSKTAMISNKHFTFNEIAGLLSKAQIHVGMRTHSLIFASASFVPTIAIVTYPKNRGYMESIDQKERVIEFGSSLTVDNLFRLIRKTWENRETIRKELQPIITREKTKAVHSATYLKKYLD